MALITFGRTPKFDLVTPKQFLWYRDIPLGTVTGTAYAGSPLTLGSDGKLADYDNTKEGLAFVIVTDTNRGDVEFGDVVTVVDNSVSFVGKVSTDIVSGSITFGDLVGVTSGNYYALTSADAGATIIGKAQSGAVGGWVTIRYFGADSQRLAVSGDFA